MKTTTIKNFAGLTYVTVTHIPLVSSEFGDVIDMKPRELERLVSKAIIENKIPICGAEFRILKSAISLSNDAIAQKLGMSRNTVLKWGKNLTERIPVPYEILIRLLVAEILRVKLILSIDELRSDDKTKKISVRASQAPRSA